MLHSAVIIHVLGLILSSLLSSHFSEVAVFLLWPQMFPSMVIFQGLTEGNIYLPRGRRHRRRNMRKRTRRQRRRSSKRRRRRRRSRSRRSRRNRRQRRRRSSKTHCPIAV